MDEGCEGIGKPVEDTDVAGLTRRSRFGATRPALHGGIPVGALEESVKHGSTA